MLTTSPILSPATAAAPTTTSFHDGSFRPSQAQESPSAAAASSISRQQQPPPPPPPPHPAIPSPKQQPHRRPSARSSPSSRSTIASSAISPSPPIISHSTHSETSMTTAPSLQPPLRRPGGPIASASPSLSALASASVSAPASASASASSPFSTNVGRSILAQHGDDSQLRPDQGDPLTTTTTTTTGAAAAEDVPMATQTSPTAAQTQNTLSPNKRRSPHTTHDTTNDATVAQAASSMAGTDSGAAGGGASRSSSPNSSKRVRPDEQPDKVLPSRYELCSVDDMVQLIAHMLGELIATNDAIQISSGGLTRFHSRTAPAISVRDYLHRLARHATLTPPLLLSMVYYIDRLCALYPEFTINTLTVHRFLITAATVAAKGLSDSFWNNSTYARVGGVRVAELKLLELEFLYRVDWKIVPNPDVLVAYYQGLVHRCPGFVCESGSNTSEEDEDEEIGDDDDDVMVGNGDGGSEKPSNE